MKAKQHHEIIEITLKKKQLKNIMTNLYIKDPFIDNYLRLWTEICKKHKLSKRLFSPCTGILSRGTLLSYFLFLVLFLKCHFPLQIIGALCLIHKSYICLNNATKLVLRVAFDVDVSVQ